MGILAVASEVQALWLPRDSPASTILRVAGKIFTDLLAGKSGADIVTDLLNYSRNTQA